MQKVRLLYRDECLVVVEKPAGILVHPPEGLPRRAAPPKTPDMIRILREQLGEKIYPVHRLDRATSGIMVFALNSETAGLLQKQFMDRTVTKTYLALCRGYVMGDGVVDSPLTSSDEDGPEQEALTAYQVIRHFELPIPSDRHPSSRFTLVEVRPQTGRWHQIRRHFKRMSHPLIGDTVHGDGKQNRVWRELSGESRLYLLAWYLGFFHPKTKEWHSYRARFHHSWHQVFDQAQLCPYLGDHP